jgi:hypothetical protein
MQVLRAVLLLAAAAAATASDSHGRQPIADEHLVSHFCSFSFMPRRDEICTTFSRSMASLCVGVFFLYPASAFAIHPAAVCVLRNKDPDLHTEADNLLPAHFCA